MTSKTIATPRRPPTKPCSRAYLRNPCPPKAVLTEAIPGINIAGPKRWDDIAWDDSALRQLRSRADSLDATQRWHSAQASTAFSIPSEACIPRRPNPLHPVASKVSGLTRCLFWNSPPSWLRRRGNASTKEVHKVSVTALSSTAKRPQARAIRIVAVALPSAIAIADTDAVAS